MDSLPYRDTIDKAAKGFEDSLAEVLPGDDAAHLAEQLSDAAEDVKDAVLEGDSLAGVTDGTSPEVQRAAYALGVREALRIARNTPAKERTPDQRRLILHAGLARAVRDNRRSRIVSRR